MEQVIVGLAKDTDGRWRVMATGQRFVEADERKAVEKFYTMTGQINPRQTFVGETVGVQEKDEEPKWDCEAMDRSMGEQRETGVRFSWDTDGRHLQAGVWVPEALLYRWVADQLRKHRVEFARKVGVPAIAMLDDHAIPKPSLRLEALLDIYKKHADVQSRSKQHATRIFENFVKITKAKTLADLTTEVLTMYRDTIKARVTSPGTITAYFGAVKWIIKFAKTEGQDAVQIDACLSRMAILKAPRDTRVHTPSPISPANFGKLLEVVREDYPAWEARLLVMLNFCLHFDEALAIEWVDLNFEAGTFCTRRNKRGRVIRCATLWPETVDTLKAIKRTGSPYVFTSTHGTRFNAKGQWKTWEKIRKAAGCPEVQMDDIRDGSYSAACTAPGVDEKYARLLAGHRSHGLQDNYVARNPAIVRGACEAVRATFADAIKGEVGS